MPIELLDVAGLVPGAHEGKGLGNKFLDDLRHADALVHVVDVSGTTDAEGKATRGYDPSADIVWLRGEIVRWIEGNLVEKWYEGLSGRLRYAEQRLTHGPGAQLRGGMLRLVCYSHTQSE